MKIAIIGAACRLPGGVVSLETLWDVLASGRDAVSEIPADRFDVAGFLHPTRTSPGRSCTFAAGVLDGIDQFDYSFFGISKKEAEYMDPQQRLLLELAWETLEDAQLRPSSLAGADTAVFVGSSSLDASMQRSDDPSVIGPYSMIGNTLSILANRISYLLDIHGPSMTIDTACSSSLVALHQACQCLASGEASMALAGGVHMLCCPLPFVGFSKAHMLSKDGRCRVFAKDANGYVRAEGGGLLLLKPLDKALEDGDRIHAVIAKTGVNTDGKTIGIAFPNRTAQMALLESLYGDSSIDPRNISYMEAHGTGTAVGDPAEAQSIGEVFARLRPAQQPPLLVGSVKSNLGHLEPASGMAGLFKTLLVLKHRAVPPNLHLENPSPDIDFKALRLNPVTALTPLPVTPGPAVAGVNSFGFGGSNAHAVLEEAPAPRPAAAPKASAAQELTTPGTPGTPPLLLSARSPHSLKRLAQAYAPLVREADAPGYAALAGRAALRRDHLSHRLVLQAASPEAIAEGLERLAMDEEATAEVSLARGEILGGVVRTAFVFSGNGGTWPGMGRALILDDRDAARALDALDDSLSPLLGWSVAKELLGDPAAQRLDSIAVVQPLLFSMQVCLAESLRAKGVQPDMVFGHSIGEVAAAWCCGALTLEQACTVIVERSRLQQESRGLGGMAVVQLAEEEARALPEVLAGELEVAAVNSSKYVTLSGAGAALDALKASARKRRLVFRRLNLDYPFHSRAMDAIKDRLLEKLAAITPSASRIPFYSTVEGACCPGETLDADYWWRNIRQPVLFHKAALAALTGGGRVFVELGPDAMLQPFLKGCFQEYSATTVYLPSLKRDVQDGRVAASLWKQVHTAGGAVDLTAFFPHTPPHVPLPSYPWDREPCLAESTPECLDVFGAKPPAHPLLGRRVRRGMPVWENTLDPHLVPFLREHVVGEDVVLPGAAFLEMALAAALEAYGLRTVELENVEYRQPMTFGKGKARVVRLVLAPEQGDFTIESREQMQASTMTVHVVGRMVPRLRKTFEPEAIAPDTIARGVLPQATPCDVPALYAKARDAGLAFGPAFRPLRQVWRAGSQAFARLELEPHAEFAGAVLHPSLVDGSFQMLLSLVDWREKGLESYVYLPMRTGRFQLLEPGRAVYAKARLESQSTRSLAASFSLYDEHGHELARMQDCRFARFQTRDSLLRQQQVYAVTTVAARHPLDHQQQTPAPWPAVQASGFAAGLEALQRAPRWQSRRQDVLPFLTALLLAQAHETFQALAPDPGGFSVDHLLHQGGIQAEHAPYLLACLHVLEQMDLAAHDGGLWSLKESDLPPSLELWRQALREYPAYAGELALMAQAGEAMLDLLRGTAQARTLLALRPGSALEQLHRTSPLRLDANAAAAAVVSALLKTLPQPGGLRLLEVEAGAGGLTQAMLSRLAPGVAEYVLTDRDEHFVEQLKARWTDRPDVAACVFDPEDSDSTLPETAAAGAFDLILLGHGLARIADLPQVLDRLHGLLRPGGLLLAVDALPHPAHDLLLGLAPDWWREDRQDGAAPRSRLLAGAEWQAALAEAGFEDIRSLLEDTEEADLYLGLARKPCPAVVSAAAVALPHTQWVLLEDTEPDPVAAALAEALCAAIAARGGIPPVRLKINGVDPESAEDWARQCTDLAAAAPQGAGLECIHLLGFDTRQALDAHTLDALQNRRTVSTVALAQGWQQARSSMGLCLVTGGGLPLHGVAARSARPVPSQGALPGLGRVLMNEMPGLQVRLVDVHAQAGPAGDAPGVVSTPMLDAVVREILHPAGPEEREVILSNDGRFCQRLAPLDLAARVHPPATAPAAFSLEMTAQGKLDGATWAACQPPRPGAGQVLVANQAAGVNYRDIMFTLGRIPEEALEGGASGPTLGLECAGTVLAVGEGVEGLTPGDSVCCLGGKLYDSHVLARAGDVFPLPAGMAPSDAATIPVAHFTAWYALTHLARLQPGERVLIHGAAGGVGLAAIQIAMLLGAEIFATAGSPAKRTLLERLGVPHVLNSRTLDFEEAIRQRTDGQGVDVVLNSISGEALFKSVGLLRPLGRFLELGKVDFYTNSPLRMRLLRNNISFFGIDVDEVMRVSPQLCRRLFLEMLTHFERGELWALPHALHPHAAIPDAFRAMQQSRHIGKLVVTHGEDAPAAVQPALPAPLAQLPAEASYLITGGLGGLGLHVAKRLASLGARHLVLASRSGAATEAQQRAVAELEAGGTAVTVLKLDVADAAAVQQGLANALSGLSGKSGLSGQSGLPPLRGVVHCAGVLRDATIANLTPQDIRTVLRAKALGGWNLHRAVESIPLDFFIMFSSATTVLGNPGQGNYVAANTMLENLAAYRRSLGLPAVTFGWGPVSDAGMLLGRTNVLESLKTITGAQELRAETAMDFLETYCHHDLCTLHVFKVSFKKLARLPYVGTSMYRFLAAETAGEQLGQEQADIREALRGLSAKEAVAHLAGLLAQHFARILRVPVSRVRHDKPLSELGMDSLMYVELGLATEEAFGVDISALTLDKTDSILTLAEMIRRMLEQPDTPEHASAEAVAQRIKKVHGIDMSPAQAQQLLESSGLDSIN